MASVKQCRATTTGTPHYLTAAAAASTILSPCHRQPSSSGTGPSRADEKLPVFWNCLYTQPTLINLKATPCWYTCVIESVPPMTMAQMRAAYDAQPFKPFVIHLADGRQLPVQSREYLSSSPSGRT